MKCAKTHKVILDQHGVASWSTSRLKTPLPSHCDHIITELWHVDPKCSDRSLDTEPPESEIHVAAADTSQPSKLTGHQLRQLRSQVIQGCSVVQRDQAQSKRLVVEVFSPPRFATVAEDHGFKAKSVDIKLGTDLLNAKNRTQLKQELRDNPPELLTLSPPCTHEGGWFNLNSTKMERFEYLKLKAQSRILIRFCAELFQQQVSLGGRAVWESHRFQDLALSRGGEAVPSISCGQTPHVSVWVATSG